MLAEVDHVARLGCRLCRQRWYRIIPEWQLG
jgi:hypothetical protein